VNECKPLLVGNNETESVSSLAPPPLRIMGQSYYVRPAATMMTSTYSHRGVTAHQAGAYTRPLSSST